MMCRDALLSREHMEKVKPGTGRETGLGHQELVERLAWAMCDAKTFNLWARYESSSSCCHSSGNGQLQNRFLSP